MKTLLPDLVTGYPLDKSSGFGDFGFVIPEESTNLITQPSMDLATRYTNYNSTLSSITATEQKFGSSCIRLTRTAGSVYGTYYSHAAVGAYAYTFSAYVKARKGTALWIEARAAVYGSLVVRKKYYANGEWQRMVLVFSTATGTNTYSLCVVAEYPSGAGLFYTDGWQLERKAYATTWFDGNSSKYTMYRNPIAYYWNGVYNNSISTRTRQTRDGGRIVTLSELGINLMGILGLGFRGVQNIIQTLNDGSGFYEGTINTQRQFSVVLQMYGRNYDELNAKKTKLLQCLYPDASMFNEPIKLMIQKYDKWGQSAKEIEILCHYAGSAESEINNVYQQKIALVFDMPVPGITDTGDTCISLGFVEDITYHYISKMDRNGQWSNLNNGFNDSVYDLIQTPDGLIWAAGSFTQANGAACKLVSYWDGSVWASIYNFDSRDQAQCMATDGIHLWVGGIFTYTWANTYLIEINLSTLAVTPISDFDGLIVGLEYDPRYNLLWIAGYFTGNPTYDAAAGGRGITCHNMGAAWGGNYYNCHGLTAPDEYVRALCIGPDGNIYATGGYTGIGQGQAGGTILCSGLSKYTILPVNNFPDIGNGVWTSLGNLADGTTNSGYMIKCGPDGRIYLGGDFLTVNGVSASGIAVLQGDTWYSYKNGVFHSSGGGQITDVSFDRYGKVYAVGYFTRADTLNVPESMVVLANKDFLPPTLDLGGSNRLFYSVLVSLANEIYVSHNASADGTSNVVTVENMQETTYPTLNVIGPGVLSSIINWSNGCAIYFNRLELLDGESIYIVFTPFGNFPGSSIGRDIGSYIIGGSDTEFKLSKGDNYITTYMYENTSASTKAWLSYKKQYDGIEAISNVSV